MILLNNNRGGVTPSELSSQKKHLFLKEVFICL